MYAVDSDPCAAKFLGGAVEKDKTHRVLEENIAFFDAKGYGLFAVCHKDNSAVLGYCGFVQSSLFDGNEPEIICGLSSSARSNGFGPEATKAVAEWALQDGILVRVLASIAADNSKAISLAHKVGFKFLQKRDAPTRDGRRESIYVLEPED